MDRKALEFIGMMFETKVVLKLKEIFKDSVVLHNINVYSNALKKETQIDIILIMSGGIFVIEAKNFTIAMKGSYDDTKWELRSSDNKAKWVFNSLNQNLLHIRALNAATYKKFKKLPVRMHNLVCFPDGTYLNTDIREVCNFSGLIDKINERLDPNSNIDIYKYASLFRKIDKEEIVRQAQIYGLNDTRVTHLRSREE